MRAILQTPGSFLTSLSLSLTPSPLTPNPNPSPNPLIALSLPLIPSSLLGALSSQVSGVFTGSCRYYIPLPAASHSLSWSHRSALVGRADFSPCSTCPAGEPSGPWTADALARASWLMRVWSTVSGREGATSFLFQDQRSVEMLPSCCVGDVIFIPRSTDLPFFHLAPPARCVHWCDPHNCLQSSSPKALTLL